MQYNNSLHLAFFFWPVCVACHICKHWRGGGAQSQQHKSDYKEIKIINKLKYQLMTSMKSKDNSTNHLVTMHHPICDTVVCTLTDRMLQTKQKIIIYQINKVLIQSVNSIVILKVSYYGTNY